MTTDPRICPFCGDQPKDPEDASCRWELCEKAADEGYYVKDGVFYNRIDRPAHEEICDQFHQPWNEKQRAAYEAHTAAAIERYRQAQARRTPEQIAEEQFEMRAAFGPGVEVVNIITGKRTRT